MLLLFWKIISMNIFLGLKSGPCFRIDASGLGRIGQSSGLSLIQQDQMPGDLMAIWNWGLSIFSSILGYILYQNGVNLGSLELSALAWRGGSTVDAFVQIHAKYVSFWIKRPCSQSFMPWSVSALIIVMKSICGCHCRPFRTYN